MTLAERGWVAGIIDGEGCIYLHPRHHSASTFHLRLKVAMTHKVTILALRKLTGGGAIQRVRRPGTKWKDSYVWDNSTQVAAAVLRQVLPFLRTKHRQAVLAISFAEDRARVGGGGKGTAQRKKAAASKRRQMTAYRRMRKLNRKGR